MPREDLTEIAIVMDESGSMCSTADDAIGGFNQFIKDQRKVEGDANVTLVLFDNKYEIRYNGIALDDVIDLNSDTYNPGGGTALIDAIGKTVDSVSDRIGALPDEERPGKVILIIITDGQENASREYKRSHVSKKINEHQSREGWEMVFIGASADILEQADDLGIRDDRMIRYAASAGGTKRAYSAMTDMVGSYRSEGSFTVKKDLEEDKSDD